MTCFNPKYAVYSYGPIYETKHFKRIIGYDKENKPITEKIFYKTGNHRVGKHIKFIPKKEFDPKALGNGQIIIPCQKCLGCRLDHAATYGLRGLLESKQWKNNCFITLTYNDEHLPKDHNLHKEDIQNFLKRLRDKHEGVEFREWKGKWEKPIRYFYSGEYGPLNLRPHFHIGIFNWKPNDLKVWKPNEYGHTMYLSKEIEKIWGKGFITVEDMNYNTAQYIGRYTAKKALGMTDEKIKSKGLKPEFIETSRRGGLAYQIIENKVEYEKMKRNFGFFIKNHKGNIIRKGIPNYLKRKWRDINDIEFFEISEKRAKESEECIQKILKERNMQKDEYLKKQKELTIMKLKHAKLRRNKATTTTA